MPGGGSGSLGPNSAVQPAQPYPGLPPNSPIAALFSPTSNVQGPFPPPEVFSRPMYGAGRFAPLGFLNYAGLGRVPFSPPPGGLPGLQPFGALPGMGLSPNWVNSLPRPQTLPPPAPVPVPAPQPQPQNTAEMDWVRQQMARQEREGRH